MSQHVIDLKPNNNGDFDITVVVYADGTAILIDDNAVDHKSFIDCETLIIQTMKVSNSATLHTPGIKE